MDTEKNRLPRVEELTGGIRREIQRNLAEKASAGDPTPDWVGIYSGLRLAEEHKDVGTTLSPMTHWPRFVQPIAEVAAGVVLYLSRVVTTQQRVFNAKIVDLLEVLADVMRNFEDAWNGHESRVAKMENLLSELKEEIALQKRRLDAVSEEAKRDRRPVEDLGYRPDAKDSNSG